MRLPLPAALLVQLQEVVQRRVRDNKPALLRGADVPARLFPEPREDGVEVVEPFDAPGIESRLREPAPAQRRPVVEGRIAARLQMGVAAEGVQHQQVVTAPTCSSTLGCYNIR